MIYARKYDDIIAGIYDNSDEKVIGVCAVCGHEIYEGQAHFDDEGTLIHDESECLDKYAHDRFIYRS